MAASVSATASTFISGSLVDWKMVATIDGSAPGAVKTIFQDSGEVQLRRARTEESGFDWAAHKIVEVRLKDIIIYDDIDVSVLSWLIIKNIKVVF